MQHNLTMRSIVMLLFGVAIALASLEEPPELEFAMKSAGSVETSGVVVHREGVCVVREEVVRVRFCADLSLKDVDIDAGVLRHLSWLRMENVNALLPGDANGPLGTRLVLSFRNQHASGSNTSGTTISQSKIINTVSPSDLTKVELLLKQVVGGAALGWERNGHASPDDVTVGGLKDIREAFLSAQIKSPLKNMVVLPEGAGLGLGEVLQLSSSPIFEDFIPDLTIKSKQSGAGDSTVGFWHWLPGFLSNGRLRNDGWPSFFPVLGQPKAHPNLERRGPILQQWLVGQASMWAKELSSSLWQVHQRSLSLVSSDGGKGLSLYFCESALASSPSKWITESHRATATIESSQDINSFATKLSDCKSSGMLGGKEGHYVLQAMQRTLVGNGAHRQLRSVVNLAQQSRGFGVQAGACYLSMLERLPIGVFADQFELQGLQRRGVFKKAMNYGDINLEQPALLSGQSIVEVYVSMHGTLSNSSNGLALLEAEVILPLHARYPPLSVESHGVVHIPSPHMFVVCQQGEVDHGTEETPWVWIPVVWGNTSVSTTTPEVLEWFVPAGNPAHFEYVARFTAIAALIGVLVIFAASASTDRDI